MSRFRPRGTRYRIDKSPSRLASENHLVIVRYEGRLPQKFPVGSALNGLALFRGLVDRVVVEGGIMRGKTKASGIPVEAQIFSHGRPMTSMEIYALIPALKKNLERRRTETARRIAKLDGDIAAGRGRKTRLDA